MIRVGEMTPTEKYQLSNPGEFKMPKTTQMLDAKAILVQFGVQVREVMEAQVFQNGSLIINWSPVCKCFQVIKFAK